MSDVVTPPPPSVAESSEKQGDADLAAHMENVKLNEALDTTNQPLEAENDASSDNARENGEEDFHTPEVTNEVQNDDEAKLDDDEIEDNPAYIPRKGKYYMHDSRDAEAEVEEKKTSRADGTWKHDRYNERFQRPKTKKQIMTRYGFDIREGDAQDIEVNQKQRQEEVKKEGEYNEEPTRGKRRPKKEPRQKQRSRNERGYDTTPKSRPQNLDKSVRQLTERRPSSDDDSRGGQAVNKSKGDEDDDDLHVGQRRQVRAEHRRERHDRIDVRVVRNVRGSRGGLSGHRIDKHQQQTRERFDRDRFRSQNGDRVQYQKEQYPIEQKHYENHRRGVIRGAVRGAGNPYGLSRGQQTRTVSTSGRPSDTRDAAYQREDAPPQRNAGYSPRDSGNYYDSRGGYASRGDYSSRSRGGVSQSTRGGYGDVYPSRGFTGPKRYSEQRGEILPPPAQMAVPPPVPPTQHSFNIPRQPTDVVYFDPTQQPSRQPLPPREKKIIEIVPPSD